jgi:hypothetical protein
MTEVMKVSRFLPLHFAFAPRGFSDPAVARWKAIYILKRRLD